MITKPDDPTADTITPPPHHSASPTPSTRTIASPPPSKYPKSPLCYTCTSVPGFIYQDFIRFFPKCGICGHMDAEIKTLLLAPDGEIGELMSGKRNGMIGKELLQWCYDFGRKEEKKKKTAPAPASGSARSASRGVGRELTPASSYGALESLSLKMRGVSLDLPDEEPHAPHSSIMSPAQQNAARALASASSRVSSTASLQMYDSRASSQESLQSYVWSSRAVSPTHTTDLSRPPSTSWLSSVTGNGYHAITTPSAYPKDSSQRPISKTRSPTPGSSQCTRSSLLTPISPPSQFPSPDHSRNRYSVNIDDYYDTSAGTTPRSSPTQSRPKGVPLYAKDAHGRYVTQP